MRMTDIGASFYEQCAQVISAAEEAELSVTQMQTTPRGRLRMTAPMSFGQRFVTEAVNDYLTYYPDVTVDLDLADRTANLVEEGYDLAIRIGRLTDSTMIARRLCDARAVVVGSPSYFAARSVPRTPADLGAHECLMYSYAADGDAWRFDGPDGPLSVRVRGRLRVNNGDALATAAIDGLGLAMLPDFIVADDIRNGRLVRALEDMCPSLGGVYAVYPENRHLSAKVRVFVEQLEATFSSR
jgi:DNA-binding transcriptional LysR family regulator